MQLSPSHVICLLTCLLTDQLLDYAYLYDNRPRTETGTRHHRRTWDSASSSVWCRGLNYSSRICVFRNLYYRGDTGDFVFLHGPGTTLLGDVNERNDPALTDLSSVKDHGAFYFTFVDLPVSALSQFRVVDVHTDTLVMSDLIPIFSTLREMRCCSSSEEVLNCLDNITLFLADEREKGPYWQLCKILARNWKVLHRRQISGWYRFKKAIVGLRKDSTWYQYGFVAPQGPLNANLETAGAEVKYFVQFFLHAFNVPATSDISEKYALIISRTRNRLITNIDELALMVRLHARLIPIIIDLENKSLREVIILLRDTQLLISMHGSALILSAFLQPGSAVLEMFPYGINPDNYTPYKTLASLPGMMIAYAAWTNINKNNTVFHPEYEPRFGGIYHMSQEAQQLILQSEQVPLHLCCDNPKWLFHIYQDTAVDSSIIPLLVRLSSIQTVDTSDTDQETFFPGPVMELRCEIMQHSGSNKQLTVSWLQPWNIAFISFRHCSYEVWLKSGAEVEMFHTNLTVFNRHIAGSIVNVWVKAMCDKRSGRFNIYPPSCKDPNL
uniref:Putative glycosyltransferase ixodes scapularis glycosyltransferase n=1 Tax=Amblyomma triste TaxID=251400 RepID=A0A023GNB4_AMBTT